MIKIDKGFPPTEFSESQKIQIENERMKEFYSRSGREQERFNFRLFSRIVRELKPILHDHFNGKCGYCEISLPEAYFEIDNYRPKAGVRDNDAYFKDLYWWLTYDWDNLVYSCQECNRYKASYFPIKGKRALNPDSNIEEELPFLLNPCIDNPEEHLTFEAGIIGAKTERGKYTIDLLRLNRDSLVEKRKEAIVEINDIIYKIARRKHSLDESELDKVKGLFYGTLTEPFVFGQRQLLLKAINDYPDAFNEELDLDKNGGIDELLAYSKEQKREFETQKRTNEYFPIEYVEIQNFKNIDYLKLNFPKKNEPTESWLFLLGENGVGKSSILQAIAIGLNPNIEFLNDQVSELVMVGKKRAKITIKERDSKRILTTELIIRSSGSTSINEIIPGADEFSSYLLGYGAFRLMNRPNLDFDKSEEGMRYKNLFDPSISLYDVFNWLIKLHSEDKNKFDIIATSLLELLPNDGEGIQLTVNNRKVVFSNQPNLSLSVYSEGYKAVLSLALDIMYTLSSSNADMDKLTGIVLIDEIGNQLHPRWQMRIVKQLRKVFPLIQFVVSSHSPLCLRGIREGEVVLVKKNMEGEVVVNTNLPNPEHYTLEQLLKSDFFGLHSTADETEDSEFKKYYELLIRGDKVKLSETEATELKNLQAKFKPKEEHFGSSLRDEIAYQIMDELLAKHYYDSESTLSRDELKETTIRKIKDAWKNIDDL